MSVAPYSAKFHDGMKNHQILDAVTESSTMRRQVAIDIDNSKTRKEHKEKQTTFENISSLKIFLVGIGTYAPIYIKTRRIGALGGLFQDVSPNVSSI